MPTVGNQEPAPVTLTPPWSHGSMSVTPVGVEKVTVISDEWRQKHGNKKEECLPCCGSPFSEAC